MKLHSPIFLDIAKKVFLFFSLNIIIISSLHSQLAVFKMVGKNSSNSKIGFGTFVYWDIPVNETGNNSVMVELLDLGIFPRKNSDIDAPIGYASIKVGYRHIFSDESKTGFFIEPSAGYCRVVNSAGPNGTYGDGVAIAAETGYSIEVGQRANTLVFGLKYESDLAGTGTTINALSFRFSYSFHMFRKKSDN